MFKLKYRGLSITKELVANNLSKRCFSNNNGRLENKVTLITGAASGIGKATATEFIKNGAKVVIADIQDQLGQQTAFELGPNATYISCNVSQESDVSSAIDFTVSKYGHIDIMFNNAAISDYTPPSIVDLNLDVFDKVMNTNVRGVLAGIKHASRVMIPQHKGSIICTSSVCGIIGGLGSQTYSISKFAVAGMVKSIAAELSGYGVRVNCISPFGIPTPFAIDDMKKYYPEAKKSQLESLIYGFGELAGTNCEVEDIANAALYLASDDAKYVSGHNLVVDGGFTQFKKLHFPIPDELV